VGVHIKPCSYWIPAFAAKLEQGAYFAFSAVKKCKNEFLRKCYIAGNKKKPRISEAFGRASKKHLFV